MELKKAPINISKIIAGIILTLTFFSYITIGINTVSAQSNGNTYDEDLAEQLLLELPEVTENPNYTITFTDPGGEGVELEIDGQEPEEIKSPYELPTLGIGEHKLTFKFADEEEVSQTLIKEIVIIPRPPQINTPELISSKLYLSGIGVAGGQIELFITNGKDHWKKEIEIDKSGTWTFEMDKKLNEGNYNVIALARKKGYTSKYSEPAAFLLEKSEDDNQEDQTLEQRIIWENLTISSLPNQIQDLFSNNTNVFIAIIGFPVLIGIVIGLLIKLIFSSRSTKKAERMLKEALSRQKDDSEKNDKKTKSIKKNSESNSTLVNKLKEKLGSSSQKPNKNDDIKTEKKPKEDTKNTTKKDTKKESIQKTEEEDNTNNNNPESDKKKKEESSKKEKNTKEPTKNEDLKKPKNKTKEQDESSEDNKPDKKDGLFSKAEFLKKFKQFDPDSDDGKEIKKEKTTKRKGKSQKKKNVEKKSKENNKKEVNKEKKRNIELTLSSGENIEPKKSDN